MPVYNYQVTITNLTTNQQEVKQLKVTAPTTEQAQQNVQLALKHLEPEHSINIQPL